MTRDEMIEVTRQAGFTVDETGKLLLWDQCGHLVINKDNNESIVDGMKRLIEIVEARSV